MKPRAPVRRLTRTQIKLEEAEVAVATKLSLVMAAEQMNRTAMAETGSETAESVESQPYEYSVEPQSPLLPIALSPVSSTLLNRPTSDTDKTKEETLFLQDLTMMEDTENPCFLPDLDKHETGSSVSPYGEPVVWPAKRPPGGTVQPEDRVDAALRKLGYAHPEKASNCAKQALHNQFLSLDDGLDQIVCTWTCVQCQKDVPATLFDCLGQPDLCGPDSYWNNEGGALQCSNCQIGRYVTKMCDGSFEVVTGNLHNHCNLCQKLGKCVGDYRELHCLDCNGHFFTGLAGFPCPCSERQPEMLGLLCGMASGFTIDATLMPWDTEEVSASIAPLHTIESTEYDSFLDESP